jgi:hypothetical protein
MLNFIELVKSKGFAQMSSTVCATGGGATKYAKEAEKVFGILSKNFASHFLIMPNSIRRWEWTFTKRMNSSL